MTSWTRPLYILIKGRQTEGKGRQQQGLILLKPYYFRDHGMWGMTCDEWPHINYFDSLMTLLELIDLGPLVLKLNLILLQMFGKEVIS